MAEQDDRSGRGENSQRPGRQDGRDGENTRGRPGVVAPSDPPVVPEVTDAEAAGTPPDAATRATAPDAGPRTRSISPPQRRPQPDRPVSLGLLLALALVLAVVAVLSIILP